MKSKFAAIATLLWIVTLTPGCQTVKGLGEDLEAAGKKIQESIDD